MLINLRFYTDCDQKIDRSSIFGNPFVIGKDGNRVEVVNKYKEYFLNRINSDILFKNEVLKLQGKSLGCWCSPLLCHGNIILEWLEENAKDLRDSR